jgi:uncharacterized iron-regulated membrane protein
VQDHISLAYSVLSKTSTVDRRAGLWRQWLWRPKTTRIRKLIFQLHLWSGLLLGLYIVVVCASGSALVFRNDIYDWLESGGKGVSYRGALYHWLSWLGKLHGSLLMDSAGMMANAIGGFLLAALCLTGIIVWWPGFAAWRSALKIAANAGWKRFVFDLHGVVGFWTFAVLLMWGLTGGYFVFPQPFRAAIELFTPIVPPASVQPAVRPAARLDGGPSASSGNLRPRRRPLTLGARILRGFSFAHYGNFGGWGVKLLWVILGLAPAALFSTALLMWYNRVLAQWIRRSAPRGRQS